MGRPKGSKNKKKRGIPAPYLKRPKEPEPDEPKELDEPEQPEISDIEDASLETTAEEGVEPSATDGTQAEDEAAASTYPAASNPPAFSRFADDSKLLAGMLQESGSLFSAQKEPVLTTQDLIKSLTTPLRVKDSRAHILLPNFAMGNLTIDDKSIFELEMRIVLEWLSLAEEEVIPLRIALFESAEIITSFELGRAIGGKWAAAITKYVEQVGIKRGYPYEPPEEETFGQKLPSLGGQ